jgi:peptidyl-prolyl cis-trans isomerase C
MTCPTNPRILASLSLFLVLTISACGVPVSLNVPTATLTATRTPIPSPTPTATPIPLAVSVNGEGITRPEFKAELARYQQAQSALGNTVSPEAARKAVSDEVIDTLLLAEGAAAKGYLVDEAALQNRIDRLTAQLGSPGALTAWQTAHGYTEASFRSDLRRQMAAAAMRDQLTASVPTATEQVHLKQILVSTAETAQKALDYLKAGRNFNELAAIYDPLTTGELGWVPRGYLTDLVVENAAFALQPGQYSAIIQSQAGYDILFVMARDPARLLSPDALLTLQEHAVQDWLKQRRNESAILFAP